MRSCLYECRMTHARFAPKPHAFAYRIFLFALDLDELPDLHRRLRWFSRERRNLYSFRDHDFLPLHEPSWPAAGNPAPRVPPGSDLKSRVLIHLADHGIDLTGGRVLLVTLPRVAGYLFNPVSFYFCYDRHDQPVAALAEVTNTFREMKPFVLTQPESTDKGTRFHLRLPKQFYVSPFSDVDVAFDFELNAPGPRLDIRIDDYTGSTRTFTSTLRGERQPLTDAKLGWFALKYPLLTLRIITLIHWHALRLWLKRVPWFAKAARREDQRGLFRPHRSLRKTTDPA
jgi:DUF1365 family protein